MRYRREILYAKSSMRERERKREENCCKILHVGENIKMHTRTFIMQTIVDAPLLRQPFIFGSTLTVTNVVVTNSGLVGLGKGLGVRSRSLYGAQTVVALWQRRCCENSLSRAPSSVVPPRLTLLGFLLRRNRK